MRHTHGKYEAHYNTRLRQWDIVTSLNNTLIAIVPEDVITIWRPEDDNTKEANARLIAAAPEYDELARLIASKPAEVQAIMKKHGFVIDNLNDRWQKFAFTLYTMIVELAEKSKNIIAKAEGEGD